MENHLPHLPPEVTRYFHSHIIGLCTSHEFIELHRGEEV